MAPAKKGGEKKKGRSAINEVVTREYTINIHKRIPGVGFKKRAPRALKEIRKFVALTLGVAFLKTPDTRFPDILRVCLRGDAFCSTLGSRWMDAKVPTAKEKATSSEASRALQNSQQAIISFASPSSKLDKGIQAQDYTMPSTSHSSSEMEALLMDALHNKMVEVVLFLCIKYLTKEPITKQEMIEMVIKEHEEYFVEIFRKACGHMEKIFGIDVKEADSIDHTYVFAKTLGLTCDEILSKDQIMPKNGLLIIILSLIFTKGNRIAEEKLWKLLNMIGLYAGSKDYIFGEPRKLITKVWVQERYLKYQQVPKSDPACYEFLWGPRAYAETSKLEVLQHIAKANGIEANAFGPWYEAALREEKQSTWAKIIDIDDTTIGH
ncbi:PREDICTED: melanoma-associated antigen 11-like [Elephantulus edwardii]|uniref:melanoma-associated antigen 11-like n=1 Tax=Elephantulus edwardii TaxID=28737 RepID=UPI0003F0E271|nr:PREDICTED: melanoma-associated antigen 11-like [Elephantulus edwardii]